MPGEHHVLFAQQDAAALGLLEQGGLGQTLQADPLVPPKDLILDIFRVGGEVVVQPIRRHCRQLGALGQGGVFQFAVGPVGRHHVQHKQGKEKQPEHHKHRVLEQRGRFSGMLVHSEIPPQKLKYRNGLLVLPTT